MSFSLNYVWIQATRLPVLDSEQAITCPIPESLMDNVKLTAKSYPDMPVYVWVDIYGAGNNTPRILQELNEASSEPNITFKSLDEIPIYRADPLFTKKHEDFEDPYDAIWQQVDLARVYVLRHQLLSQPDQGAIYADIDTVLPDLDGCKFMSIIEKHDICFCRYYKSPTADSGSVENQFFALGQGFGRKYLMSHIIPYTQDAIQHDLNGWDAIWSIVKHPDLYRALGIKHIDEVLVKTISIANHEQIKKSYQVNPAPVQFAHQLP